MIRQDFREFDESKKDTAWFRRVIVELIGRKQWLISPTQYAINMSFADATYDISKTKKKYDVFNVAPDEQFIDFQQLDLLGNRIEAIESIIEKQGFEVKSKCTDPTAVSKKEQDIALLKAEKELEPIRKQFAQGLGLSKPLPIASEDDFSSDISPVKEMDLDMTNPVDEGIYKNLFQRQIWELAVELGITHYFGLSGVKEILKQLVEDMINHNCFAMCCAGSSYSGEPYFKRLMPYSAYTVLGKRFDRSDAIAKGWEERVSVRELIQLMGKDVTRTELNEILALASASSSSTNYGFIWFPDMGGECPANACTYQQFLNMTCMLGYMEMKSQNSDLYVHSYDNGNILTQKENLDFQFSEQWYQVDRMPEKENEQYLEYKFYDVTYKGYYIPSSSFVFGFGKLPLAVRYGTKNELTDYSIITYKKNGKSMNEKCQPFIKHFFDLWCKYQHFINESRPSGENWDIDVVREIANELIGIDGKVGDVMSTLKILKNTVDSVYKTKTIDGQQTGGDGDPVKARVRGIDPTVRDIVYYMANDLQQIETITGVNSVLLAQAPPTQDTGYKVSQLYLSQSINTIHYIQSAIEQSFSNAGLNICQKIQFILNGKKSTEAYKSIEQAIGKRNVEAIKQLGKQPPYTFSIFIEFGMTVAQREEIKALTIQMMQAKAITAAQAMTINAIQNYKLASALLTYYETKAYQEAQKSRELAFKETTAIAGQQTQGELATIKAKADGDLAVANATGGWNYKIKQLEMTGKSDIQDTKELSKQISQNTKHQQSIQEKIVDKQLEDSNETT